MFYLYLIFIFLIIFIFIKIFIIRTIALLILLINNLICTKKTIITSFKHYLFLSLNLKNLKLIY